MTTSSACRKQHRRLMPTNLCIEERKQAQRIQYLQKQSDELFNIFRMLLLVFICFLCLVLYYGTYVLRRARH